MSNITQITNPDEVFSNEEQDYKNGSAYAVAIIGEIRADEYSAEYMEGFLDTIAVYLDD